MRLTERVHHDLSLCIHSGDCVVDATAGNGHDTLFLAQKTGVHGQVFSFDIQHQALETTRQRMAQHKNLASVQYIHRGHEWMQAEIPRVWHGHIQAVVFNLGYLPQANHAMITLPTTTLSALQQSVLLLARGGVISILVYTGHVGGRNEAESIKAWLSKLDEAFEYRIEIPQNTRLSPPEYIYIYKIKEPLAPIDFLGH